MIDAGGTLQLLGEEGAGTAHVDIDKEDTLEFCMEFEKPFDRQLKVCNNSIHVNIRINL
jgi:hypothetical protein